MYAAMRSCLRESGSSHDCVSVTHRHAHTHSGCAYMIFLFVVGFLSIFFHACVRRFASHSLSLAPLFPPLCQNVVEGAGTDTCTQTHAHTHKYTHAHTHTHTRVSLSLALSLNTHTLYLSLFLACSISFFLPEFRRGGMICRNSCLFFWKNSTTY